MLQEPPRAGAVGEPRTDGGSAIADLLAPACELRDDYRASRHMSDGLAMFLLPRTG